MLGQRLQAVMRLRGLSQSEVARRVGLRQSTINGIIAGDQRSTTKMHLLARELGTTTAYLEGEIDDPDEGAPSPAPSPRHQPVMLPVMLPAEAALEAAFLGVLLASEKMDQRELAQELAKRLPTVLRISATAIFEPASALDEDRSAPDEPLADAPRARRRA